MTRREVVLLFCAGLLTVQTAVSEAQDIQFELREGDRIVFLGNSFFERDLEYGQIETSLCLRNTAHDIQFRNLGWDGDTVFGHSRAGGRRRATFGNAKEGFERMTKHVLSLEPTVIFVAYGFNEAFDGQEGIEAFKQGLEKLLRSLKGPGRRFVLISPFPIQRRFGTELDHESLRSESDYVETRNRELRTYADAIQRLAKSEGHRFIDLFSAMTNVDADLSDNGIHLNEQGYRRAAEVIASSLSQPTPKWKLDSPQAERLRQAIIKKNTLYFHRWRPRNDAFVYGERKDEQKIAQSEPAQFEPFVAKQESLIREMLKGANE